MRLKIIRARSVQAVEFVKPFLLPDDDIPVETFVEQITQQLGNPAMLFLMAFDEDEGDENKSFIGFAFAFAPADVGYVQISQVHIVKNIPGIHVVDTFYMYISGFAEALRRFELRMETERDPKGFTRKYGFEPTSVSMRKKINTDLDTVIAKRIADLSKGISHEQGRPEDSEFVDEKSARYLEPDSGVPGSGSDGTAEPSSPADAGEQPDITGSDTLPGEFGSASGEPVQPGEEPDLQQLAEQVRERQRVSGQ